MAEATTAPTTNHTRAKGVWFARMLDGHMPVMPQSAGAMRFTLTAGQRLDLGTIKIADVPRSSTSSTSSISITARPR